MSYEASIKPRQTDKVSRKALKTNFARNIRDISSLLQSNYVIVMNTRFVRTVNLLNALLDHKIKT